MSEIDNATLRAHYSNLTFLFDLLQPAFLNNIDLLKEEDEDEYKKLLKTSVVSAYTNKNFPQILKEKQELINDIKEEQRELDTVSTCCFFRVNAC